MESTKTIRVSFPAALNAPDDAQDTDTQQLNPLAQSAGLLRDDPFWDEMMASIRRHRAEIDAEWDTAE